MFKPKWLDDLTIEYDNPNGDNRLQYVIPANFFVDQQTRQKLSSQIEN